MSGEGLFRKEVLEARQGSWLGSIAIGVPLSRWLVAALASHRAPPADYREALRFGCRRTLPMMLQTEAAECALACLAMVAVYHGHEVDLASLRRRFSLSLKGATSAQVMRMAARLGFASRPLKLDLPDLKRLKRPCLLHWDMNHFVVLKRVTSRGIVIHDPAHGMRAPGHISNGLLCRAIV